MNDHVSLLHWFLWFYVCLPLDVEVRKLFSEFFAFASYYSIDPSNVSAELIGVFSFMINQQIKK